MGGDRLERSLTDERHVRLVVPNVRHQRLEVCGVDVGRVRDDEIVRSARKAVAEIVLDELDLQLRQPHILTGELKSLG